MSEQFVDAIGATEALQIPSVPPNPISKRKAIKHMLLGDPQAVRHTIHRLHQLHYAQASDWSGLLLLPDRPLLLAPNPGDTLAILSRYLNLQ